MPYPSWGSCDQLLIYPLARLKLPVLAASKSLRRSRKAGAARMDAGRHSAEEISGAQSAGN
ncbi:LysR family transcriptional regulator [Klebsiella pneumoniae]|nr:LysR family transcriptional regulator [Klebsiella pneumoniae]